MNEINEKIFQATEILTQKFLNNQKYDSTIVGIINRIVDEDNGEYLIEYQGSTYTAYDTANLKYSKGDTVYVTVPQNDFTKQKFIQGKSVLDSQTDSVIYQNPFKSFLILTDNLINDKAQSFNLIAGGPQLTDPSIEKDNISYKTLVKDNQQKGFTRLGVRCNFKSLLPLDYNITSGEYGLSIQLINQKDEIFTFVFSSKELFGDIYHFINGSVWSKVIDISTEVGDIKDIKVKMFQQNFTDLKEISEIPDLIINKIEFYLGYDSKEIKKDFLNLYTPDALVCEFDEKTKKQLKIRLVQNKKNVDLNQVPNVKVFWYHYSLGHPSVDDYAGPNWEFLTEEQISLDLDKRQIKLKSDKEKESYKVIILDGENILSSNVLTFINTKEIIKQETLDAISALEIRSLDSQNGLHYVYDENNRIIHSAKKTFELKVLYQNQEIKEFENIQWMIPKKNTMLIIDKEKYLNNITEDENFIYIKDSTTLSYDISSVYSTYKGNNLIVAKVKINNIEYQALKNIYFGYAGTNGTDYSLSIDFKGIDNLPKYCLCPDILEDVLKCEAVLYDSLGEKIELTKIDNFNNLNIEWLLVGSKTDSFTLIKNQNNAEIKWSNAKAPSFDNLSYIQLKIQGFGDYELTAIKGIPIGKTNYLLIGADRLEYLSDGTNPIFYKQPYQLTEKGKVLSNYQIEISPNNYYEIKNNTLNLKKLNIPKSSERNIKIICKYNNEIVYTIPLAITYNLYSSSLVNQWDGKKLILDEKNNAILSTMIAAGSKNSLNQFSGVMLGDWASKANDSLRYNGLYGFKNGKMSFGFREDGTAFLGEANGGRIDFDGKRGLIQSSNYIKNQSGMKIDLEEGKIYCEGASFNGKINCNAVTLENLSANDIKSGTFSANRISGGTIDGNDINVINLSASNIKTGNLSASRISGGTLNADEITLNGVMSMGNKGYFGNFNGSTGDISTIGIGFSYGGQGCVSSNGGSKIYANQGNNSVQANETNVNLDSAENFFQITSAGEVNTNVSLPKSDASDIRVKDIILNDKSQIEDFFYNLNPVSFKYKYGNKEIVHWGLIAQEVEEKMKKFNLPPTLALIEKKDTIPVEVKNKQLIPENKDMYFLNYVELVPVCIKMIQSLNERISILEKK